MVVGTVLISINYSDALLRGDITASRLGRMLLTVAVPYVVSTLSGVGAMRQTTVNVDPDDLRIPRPARKEQLRRCDLQDRN